MDKSKEIDTRKMDEKTPTGLTDRSDLVTRKIRLDEYSKPKQDEICCLIALSGDFAGRRFDITDEEIIIGRSSDANLYLPDPHVSRMHAKITLDKNGKVSIFDLRSSNGTYVNYHRVSSAELVSGDKLMIGTTIFKFLSSNDIEAVLAKELYDAATRDPLTGVFNRRYFFDVLKREFSAFKRYGSVYSLCLVDIDFFKRINDTYGHIVGDFVLKHVADTLQNSIRGSDILCRYGGEEFVIVFTNTSLDKASSACEKLRSAIEVSELIFESKLIKITVSIGAASVSKSDTDPTDLIKRADSKLYQAKESGRNKFCC
jgi:diguanylate cyclase (GGDEF)-like protein